MSRDNGGVRSKVSHDVKYASNGGRAGREGDEGGLSPVGGEVHGSQVSNDMQAITGSKGSSGKVQGMGGVGSYGMGADEQKKGYFKDKH